MGELSREKLSKLGFEGCKGVPQTKLKTGTSGDSKSQGKVASDSGGARDRKVGDRHLAPSCRATYLLLWRGEHRLFLPSCFLGLFLSLPDQLLYEAAWDDREEGRGRGRRRTLLLFPNLFCRRKGRAQ